MLSSGRPTPAARAKANLTIHAPPNTSEGRPHTNSNYNAPQSRPRRPWRRWWEKSPIKSSPEGAEDDFVRDVRIAYKKDNEPEKVYTVLAPFDTQCPGDWISASFLKEKWGVDVRNNPRTVAITITTVNGDDVNTFGRIWMRWSCRNTKPGCSHRMLSFNPKYYGAWFEVIDADEFDVIIGQPSIRKHELLKLCNRFVGGSDLLVGYNSHRVAIPAATNEVEVQRVQSSADARRAKAYLRSKQVEAQGNRERIVRPMALPTTQITPPPLADVEAIDAIQHC